MDVALALARLFLAAMFGIAGAAKLANRHEFTKTVSDFGVPGAFAAPVAAFLIVAELATAALLVPISTSWWGALGGFSLLFAFTAAIVVNLAVGRKLECRCFGQLRSKPVGWTTLARNVMLAVIAAAVLWWGRHDASHDAMIRPADITAAQVIGIVAGLFMAALAAQGWFLLQLFRQNGRLLLRLDALERSLRGGAAAVPSFGPYPGARAEGLPVGAQAPAFSLPDLEGRTVRLEDILAASQQPTLLVFADPGCGACTVLAHDLAFWRRHGGAGAPIAFVTGGTAAENRVKLGELDEFPVLLQADREVAGAYRAHGTPAAVVIGSDGKIASHLAMGAGAIMSLLVRASNLERSADNADPGTRPASIAPSLGDAAPLIELLDLTGRRISLKEFRGRQSVVVFWHPECGHCTGMLADLRRRDAEQSKEAPQLLVISGGSVKANRALALHAPVMLDPSFSVGRAVGAMGTPAAVLLNEVGNVASEVAVGAAQVVTLLGINGHAPERQGWSAQAVAP